MSKSPRAMILAAGFGTRLGELTQRRPKPMLPVCGAPLVRWSALWLRAQGVRELVINLHHLGEQIVEELGDGSALGLAIAYSHEEGMILGTGGGLRQAKHLLDDGHDSPIIVVNGKILVDLDLRPVLEAHRRRAAEATMVLRADAERVWGGSLAAAPDGTLATFLGETRTGVQAGPEMMFTGIHVMQPRFIDRVPAHGEQCIIRTAYRQLFAEPRGIDVHTHAGYWWEHSTIERYLQGIANVLDGRASLPWAERPVVGVDPSAKIAAGVEVDARSLVGPEATIGAGARIGPHVEIGAKAHVAPGVSLERASVWPGATLEHDLVDGVAT